MAWLVQSQEANVMMDNLPETHLVAVVLRHLATHTYITRDLSGSPSHILPLRFLCDAIITDALQVKFVSLDGSSQFSAGTIHGTWA